MTNPYPVTAVVAMARNRVIGDGEKLLWHLPGDLPRVKALTMGRPLIMGRRTYLSIGRPLPGRATIVLTRQSDWSADGVMTAKSLDQAIEMAAAWIDARKGLNMFHKVGVPVLGLIENMSYFVCPSCGDTSHIFGHGGAEAEASRLSLPFLGKIPLEMEIRETADAGTPIVNSQPDSPHAKAYMDIAKSVVSSLDTAASQAPKITIN